VFWLLRKGFSVFSIGKIHYWAATHNSFSDPKYAISLLAKASINAHNDKSISFGALVAVLRH